MTLMNRSANCHNPFQGRFKRVLCCCSAGLLRSPTAALVLSQEPYSFNTRAAGLVSEFALVPVDDVLLDWADEIVVMTSEQERAVRETLQDSDKAVINLQIPDNFPYRDPELIRLIRERYDLAQ